MSGEGSSTIYALLVSIGDYHEIGQIHLPTYEKDAEMMVEALTKGLKLQKENILVLGRDGTVRARELALTMKNFDRLLKKQDSLFFYFSGHGKKGALLFSDLPLSLESVLSYIQKLPCKNKIVLLDCCYSGGFHTEGPRKMHLLDSIERFAGHGIAILASSAENEVSRLAAGGQYSLFTGAVHAAMLSRRRVRKGRISLQDLCDEIRQNMKSWKIRNPRMGQQPIFRSSMGGTVYFTVEPYRPYEKKKIFYKTGRYTLYAVESISTAKIKRLCAFVIVQKDADLEGITCEVAERIAGEEIHASKEGEKQLWGKRARVIWCYFGQDESDIIQRLFFAYTIWAADPEMEKLYFRPQKNARIQRHLYRYENPSYEMLKKAIPRDQSEEVYVKENKALLACIISKAELFIAALHELENGTVSYEQIRKDYRSWIGEIKGLYIRLSDTAVPPDGLRDWAEEILSLAGCVADLAMILEEVSEEAPDAREIWLIRHAIGRYYLSLEKLKIYEKQIPDVNEIEPESDSEERGSSCTGECEI